MAAGVASAIGYLMRARVPDLDAERWFKVILSQLVSGRFDPENHTTEQWMQAILAAVPYHPAGRFPEKKVSGLGLAGLPAAMEGERTLIEKLASLPDLPSKWAWMYDTDETGLAARLDSPEDLGSAYDPIRLHPGATWTALEEWGAGKAGFAEVLGNSALLWVLVDGEGEQPRVLDSLEALLPRTRRVGFVDATVGALEDALRDLTADPSVRVVLVGQEQGIQVVLAGLVAFPGLRDRTMAVVSVGGVIGGEGERHDWMEANFTHHKLNTEVARITPYLSLQWLDRVATPPGAFGLELRHARFPTPKVEAMTEENVGVSDLGVLPADSDPDLVAKGLWAFVTLWADTMRG